jgi:hypothetical protein
MRTTSGSPWTPVLTVAVTSTGNRLPSVARSSRATPLISPRMLSSGARWVSWKTWPATVSRSRKRCRPTSASRVWPSQPSRVLLIRRMVPSGSVARLPQGALS